MKHGKTLNSKQLLKTNEKKVLKHGNLFLFAKNHNINFSNKQKKPTDQARKLDTIGFLKIHYLTASLRALPALNAGTLLAGMSISLPV